MCCVEETHDMHLPNKITAAATTAPNKLMVPLRRQVTVIPPNNLGDEMLSDEGTLLLWGCRTEERTMTKAKEVAKERT